MTDTRERYRRRIVCAVEQGDFARALRDLTHYGASLRDERLSVEDASAARDLIGWALLAVRSQRAHLIRDLSDLQQVLPYLSPAPAAPQQSRLDLHG